MYESTLPFLQSELEYRTGRIKAASGGRRHHLPTRFARLRRGAASGETHR